MNPFGKPSVGSPVSESPIVRPTGPFLTQDAGPVRLRSASLRAGSATRDDEPSLETRRSELKPEVRKYADKLYAEIQAFYGAYGAKNAADLYARAKAGKIKVPKEDVKELLRLQTELEAALTRNELPPGQRELPPIEAFREAVERINAQVAPRKVTDFGHWNEYELIDGKLNGRVMVDRTDYPLIAGELIESIDDTKIEGCEEIYNVNGKLNGKVRILGSWYPVINGELIKRLGWRGIKDVHHVQNIDGKLNCSVKLDDSSHWKAVIDGRVLENLNIEGIEDCMWAHNVNGKLNCTAIINGVWTPVINGKPIKEINGKKIERCGFIENVDGKPNGKVSFDGEHYLPMIAGELIESIDGLRILDSPSVDIVDGKLNGRVLVEGKRHTLPVIAGELIQEIDGQEILMCDDAHSIGGKFYGRVSFSGASYLPVIGGKLMDTLQGQEIGSMIGFGGDAGGVFTGKVMVRDANGKEIKRGVFLGEVVE